MSDAGKISSELVRSARWDDKEFCRMGGASQNADGPCPVPRLNWPALRQALDAEALDVVIAVSPENFFYLTNSLLLSQKIIPRRLCCAVVSKDQPPLALVCYCEERQILQDSWITDIRTYLEYQERPMKALARILQVRGFAETRIGVEKHFLTAGDFEQLAEDLPRSSLQSADRLFDTVRALKTPAEAEILAQSAALTEQAILAAFQAASPGDSEKKVADDLSGRVLRAGATSQWVTLAAGGNTAINHPHPGSKRLTRGEILRVDVGGTFEGYQSDVARTAVVGRANQEQRSMYQRLRDAQRETIGAARPGVRAGDLYRSCKQALEDRGLSLTSQAIGHGLGIGLHEFPVLHAQETAEIQAGMVLNVEPAVMDSQGFLYHLEDLFLVTEGEPRILTSSMDTTDLFVIQ